MTRRLASASLLVVDLVVGLAAGGCEPAARQSYDAGGADLAGTTWQRIAAPDADFFSVSGSAADDVVMVGGGGTIARWNGSILAAESSGTAADLHGVFAVTPQLAYAVGQGGVVLRWDGTLWNLEPSVTTAFLTAVWADGQRALAVGDGGIAVGFDGTSWAIVATESQDDLMAITNAGGEIFAVGTLGTIARFDGMQFRRSSITGFSKTLAGASTGPGGTYVVGVDGALFRYDGSFQPVTGMPSVFLRGVAAPGDSVFVVGFDGVIARLKAGSVFVYPDAFGRWHEAVYATAVDDVWIVGTSGLVLHGPPLVDPAVDGGAG